MDEEFEIWLSDQASITAVEIDGPNSPDYDETCERLCEDDNYRATMRRVFDARICIA